MEQRINNVYDGQIANNIYNISIEPKANQLDVNQLSLKELLDAVWRFKAENRLIIRRKYLNFPSISIVFLSLFLILVSLLNVKSIITNGISDTLFSSNALFVIVLISMISLSILSRLLYSRTKYLNPLFVENNKVIYELELEIQRRKLRGENEK
ncbi:MAG: hypothetical protein [Caudoviricetes sp.]|nr:MAG: hypothetical protein [Caudoviricetes sp.]